MIWTDASVRAAEAGLTWGTAFKSAAASVLAILVAILLVTLARAVIWVPVKLSLEGYRAGALGFLHVEAELGMTTQRAINLSLYLVNRANHRVALRFSVRMSLDGGPTIYTRQAESVHGLVDSLGPGEVTSGVLVYSFDPRPGGGSYDQPPRVGATLRIRDGVSGGMQDFPVKYPSIGGF